MPRVFLVHWKEEELPERAARLEAAGYQVEHDLPDYREFRKILKADPPDAVVIDLGRLPSHGREIGVWLRDAKTTRSIPLVFVDGVEEKVERTRQLLPDAVYAPWSRIKSALKRAIANPPANPKAPGSLSGYSGTPLPKKLGIKAGFTVALVNAPADFAEILGALPDGVKLRSGLRGRNDLLIWFPKSRRDLENRIVAVGEKVPENGLWVAWPKQASGVKTDLNGNLVRELGLASGLVDYKICAIDATWSGLKFAVRGRSKTKS